MIPVGFRQLLWVILSGTLITVLLSTQHPWAPSNSISEISNDSNVFKHLHQVSVNKNDVHEKDNVESSILYRSKIADDIIPDSVQFQNPNLPIDFWNRFGKLSSRFRNSSYPTFPKIFTLELNNKYWQVLKTSEMSVMLLNAYYDNRKFNMFGPSVRIVSMINKLIPSFNIYCQLWFEGFRDPVLTDPVNYEYMWSRKWDHSVPYNPFLITCQIPFEYRKNIPAVVSLVENRYTNATNALRILYNKPLKKREFAVCVKALNFYDQDISVRLVEWIELLGILGADKIFFYKYFVHQNISKVLKYYQNLGLVDITPSTQPGEISNIHFLHYMFFHELLQLKRRNEIIHYNDCLYRNVHSYKYIVLLDIDEVIIPRNTDSWKTLLNRHTEFKITSLCTNVGFYTDTFGNTSHVIKRIPKYMHILQHVYRGKDLAPQQMYTKCFHNTELVVSVHNHLFISQFDTANALPAIKMDASDVILHHYRSDCEKLFEKCKSNPVYDTSVWKFRDELIRRTTYTLQALNFFGPNNESVTNWK